MTVSLLPLVTMLICFVLGSIVLDMSTELLIIVMLISATVAGIIAVRGYHRRSRRAYMGRHPKVDR